MLSLKSTHKRKRSSSRRDAASARYPASRAIVSLTSKNDGAREVDSNESDSRTLHDLINTQTFTHQVEALIPVVENGDVSKAMSKLTTLPSARSYAARVSPLLFLDPIFVAGYMKRGKLLLLSAGKLDDDDVFCIDGTGTLTLSLTRDTYQTLGLQGQAYKRAQTSSGRGGDRLSGRSERFVVSVDLIAPSFEPGKPGYERVKAQLQGWDIARGDVESSGSWDIVMNWTNGSESFGETIQLPSRFAINSNLREIVSTPSVRQIEDVWLPNEHCYAILSRGWTDGNSPQAAYSWIEWLDEFNNLTEWLALAGLDADCVKTFSRPDELNTYEAPTQRKAGACIAVSYTGFLPCNLALRLTKVLAEIQETIVLPLAQIRSSSFADAPIIWLGKKDSDNVSGESRIKETASFDDGVETGMRERRKRNAKRQKRSYTNPKQLGHQVRNAHSPISAGGLLLCFLRQGKSRSLITVRDVGDSEAS